TRFNCDWSPDVCSAELGVKVSVFFAKCSEVKVKVNRNISSKVKYRYPKKLLKYSNKVFLLRYYTTLHTLTHTLSHTHTHTHSLSHTHSHTHTCSLTHASTLSHTTNTLSHTHHKHTLSPNTHMLSHSRCRLLYLKYLETPAYGC